MRQSILLFVGLVLSGCAVAGEPDGARPTPMAQQEYVGADTTLRRVMGQDTMDQPLLPQPGNIWAGILPGHDEAPAMTAGPPTARGNTASLATAPAQPTPPVPLRTAAAGVAKTPPPARPELLATAETTAADATPRPTPPEHGAQTVDEAAPPQVLDAPEHPMVQLAAASSARQAVAAWRRLRQGAPGLTGGHDPAISAAEVNGRRVWRLRAGGFTDIAAARSFCSDLRAARTDCWVVPASTFR